MAFIRKYWIVGLVILLVATHAVVIGYVRSEATRLKTVAASEIPIGLFYKQSNDRQWLTQLRVHLQVPPERRLAARATIEHNRWVVHEAVEEALRRLDESLFQDPALVSVKEAVTTAINEVLHEPIVEKIVINDRVDLDVREFRWRPSQELITPGEETHAAKSSTLTSVRPVRPTLSEQNEHDSDEHADGEHGDGEHAEGEHGEESADGHGEAKSGHGEAKSGHGEASGHAAKPAASSHAKPASGHAKPAASHGAAKPAAHGAKSSHAAKPSSSGHGSAKKAKSSGH